MRDKSSTAVEEDFWKAEDQIKNAKRFSVLNMYDKHQLQDKQT